MFRASRPKYLVNLGDEQYSDADSYELYWRSYPRTHEGGEMRGRLIIFSHRLTTTA